MGVQEVGILGLILKDKVALAEESAVKSQFQSMWDLFQRSVEMKSDVTFVLVPEGKLKALKLDKPHDNRDDKRHKVGDHVLVDGEAGRVFWADADGYGVQLDSGKRGFYCKDSLRMTDAQKAELLIQESRLVMEKSKRMAITLSMQMKEPLNLQDDLVMAIQYVQGHRAEQEMRATSYLFQDGEGAHVDKSKIGLHIRDLFFQRILESDPLRLLEFSRNPECFRRLLLGAEFLQDCILALKACGYNPVLESGAKAFVRPGHYSAMQSSIEHYRLKLSPRHVIVSEEHESMVIELVKTALPKVEKVKLKGRASKTLPIGLAHELQEAGCELMVSRTFLEFCKSAASSGEAGEASDACSVHKTRTM